jgi:predicted RNA methylase
MKFEDFKLISYWDTNEINIFNSFYNEIWNECEYDRYGVFIEENDKVVDLGASIGIFSQYAVHMGASVVYSFESDTDRYNLIKENTKNTNKVIPFNALISGYSNENDYNLEKIFNVIKESHIDFMKVDIE